MRGVLCEEEVDARATPKDKVSTLAAGRARSGTGGRHGRQCQEWQGDEGWETLCAMKPAESMRRGALCEEEVDARATPEYTRGAIVSGSRRSLALLLQRLQVFQPVVGAYLLRRDVTRV